MDIVQDFYDNLAEHYDKLFLDWQAESDSQAVFLSRIFADNGFDNSAKILDCACGIGTQAIGLAALGYNVIGSDISNVELAEAENEIDTPIYTEDKITRLFQKAEEKLKCGALASRRMIIDQYIDKIFATPMEDGTIRLDIRIFTGEATEKYLKKLKVRTGQISCDLRAETESPTAATTFDTSVRPGIMSKKMIEAYEQSMQ